MTEGWVIMNANMDQYRAWQDGGTVWVKDLADATFYARRVDAEAVHLDDDAAWRVVLRPLPDGGEAVHTGQIRDEPVSSPPPSGVREADIRRLVYNATRATVPDFGPSGPVIIGHEALEGLVQAIFAAIPGRDEAALPEAVAWRVRCGLNHPLVEGKPFDWRLSEKRPELGNGAKPEWFDIEPLYAAPSPPPVGGQAGDVVRETIIAAYLAGAQAVHDAWSTDPFPEFEEAAHDYAASIASPVPADREGGR